MSPSLPFSSSPLPTPPQNWPPLEIVSFSAFDLIPFRYLKESGHEG